MPHKRLGKLLVASNERKTDTLRRLKEMGEQVGVEGLRLLESEADAQSLAGTRELRCPGGALYSEQTGIVDSHALMLALLGDVEENGAVLSLRTEVERPTAPTPCWWATRTTVSAFCCRPAGTAIAWPACRTRATTLLAPSTTWTVRSECFMACNPGAHAGRRRGAGRRVPVACEIFGL